MYMNGEGINARADELMKEAHAASAAMWDALPSAFLGGFAGASIAVFPAISNPYWFFISGPLGFLVWLFLSGPWREAGRRCERSQKRSKAHADACRAETEKRGQGWARN